MPTIPEDLEKHAAARIADGESFAASDTVVALLSMSAQLKSVIMLYALLCQVANKDFDKTPRLRDQARVLLSGLRAEIEFPSNDVRWELKPFTLKRPIKERPLK